MPIFGQELAILTPSAPPAPRCDGIFFYLEVPKCLHPSFPEIVPTK
ncbi:MAG: hypothetical protein F6K31_30060 [Symploca sp. SIO2G7]|nr:hypothetical protein [Symploca sp. SIO2G7]